MYLSLRGTSGCCGTSGSTGLLENSIGEDVEGKRTTHENGGGGVVSPSGDIGDIFPLIIRKSNVNKQLKHNKIIKSESLVRFVLSVIILS